MGIAVFKRIQHLLQHMNLVPFFVNLNSYLPAWKELFMMQEFLLKGRMLAITAKIVNSEV